MSRIRLAAVSAMVSCGLLLVGGTSAAGAQEAARLTQVVPMSGTVTKGGQKGKPFTGTYTIERFVNAGGALHAVGTVKGKAGNKSVTKKNVRVPAAVANSAAAGGAQASQVPPLPLPPLPAGNACSILSLDLGPINLNVLGLVVRTNQIQLRIDAVQGPGNLLGNLLCAITGLLNPATGGSPVANTPLGQLVQILNALLALSPRTA
ncbi:hypothetical protein DVA67_001885 [Solirubrobacter sp. CPCC 204708]|uniref:ABC transporter substrate-binding protein n=1 Tax=Solirubrobacter deserti TaxID=2282478 RepID=A0ABT4RS08_9ACTN|nr:hypothetical protein [Solirubrobacter deserti]MBE2314708.1 hypothetical protein [Solirubrobacter deserti]MDA0141025.1 hypothetical protein [Solirubrobacter deserti]